MLPFFVEISIDFPTFNRYIQIERSNRGWASSVKKKYTNDVKMFLIGKKISEFPIQVEFIWNIKSELRDIDSFSFAKKCIFDGMVNCGFIPDDRLKYIKKTIDRVKKSKKDGVLLVITKYEEE